MRRFLLTTVLLTAAFFSSAQSSQTVAPQTGTRPVFMKPRDWGGFNRYAAANAEVKTAPRAIFLGVLLRISGRSIVPNSSRHTIIWGGELELRPWSRC